MQYKLPNGKWVETTVLVDPATGLPQSSGSGASSLVPTSATNSGTAVTATATPLTTSNAARLTVRFYNAGANPVAIGVVGLTWATRCIVLDVGGFWSEQIAPNLVWVAICDATKSTLVNVQEILV